MTKSIISLERPQEEEELGSVDFEAKEGEREGGDHLILNQM